MPTDARTIYEEGVVIPPFALYKAGQRNEDALRVILNQVRVPDWNRADLNGLVAACRTASRRVQEMCARFGTDTYLSALDDLLDRNYRAMKTLLHVVFEEGRTLSFTDYICDDGVGYGPYELKLSLTRTGDKVHLDFTGSSPQAVGPVNYYLNENLARMFFGIYMITVADPQILWNDGFYPLVDVTIPDGSYWKPRHPAALNARNHGIGRVFDLFGGLLGQTNPALLNAAGFSSSPHFMYSGNYSGGERKGEWFQLYSIGFGGIPGRPLGDGPDGHSLWPSFVNIPCEFLESYYPLRIERWETVADTGGAGLHRGGNGVDVAYHFLEPGTIAIHDDRWLTYPWGVNGGTPGARGRKWVDRADGTREVLPSKCHDVPVAPGDVLHFVTWGGGGWGDPLERDPALVALEVRRGLVTADGARRYGVVVTADGAADLAATGALRDELRAARPAELPVFDMGPALPELLARCQEETGLPAPRQPVWT
jgi:N-methylhydantoinase B